GQRVPLHRRGGGAAREAARLRHRPRHPRAPGAQVVHHAQGRGVRNASVHEPGAGAGLVEARSPLRSLALATIAYETLTGDLPVAGDDAEELLRNLCAGRMVPIRARNPRLPHALGAFFDKAFAERVDERYSSAADMA